MVDSPYYRPPDEPERPPSRPLAPGRAPMPFGATRPTIGAASGVLPSANGEVPPLDGGEPVEELWSVVATLPDEALTRDLIGQIEAAGIETWVRAVNDLGISTGLARLYEVLVPEADEPEGLSIAEETAERWELVAAEQRPEPSGDGCRRAFVTISIIVLVAVAVILVAAGR